MMTEEDSELIKWQKAALAAFRTAKWAKIMTKWLITSSSKNGVKWHVVSFDGKTGREPVGVVDLIAIRKKFAKSKENSNPGDLFEMVLIQVKGGTAERPSKKDVERLSLVKEHHRADRVVLAEWQKAKKLCLYEWDPLEAIWNPKNLTWSPKFPEWKLVEAKEVFGIVSKKTMLEIKKTIAPKTAVDPLGMKQKEINTPALAAIKVAKNASAPLTAGEKAARTRKRNLRAKQISGVQRTG